ncbi:tachylectin-related carbohydrate-binding protein [Actinosynnema pretiosum]|uniref:tachylectin-related carbohydrate-binding protein n=1 Tax=Actinosynnema pretiosum TaxID=42197 RepID=UPI0015A66ABA|nr:tachylectin-related carbohydrate-binding protein [Actinosynnema pretiosum]
MFGVTPGGDFFRYPHEEPENGNLVWGVKRVVGSGWHIGRTLAGPDGVVYSMVAATGELRRYRWNESAAGGQGGWDSWNGAQFRVVGGGWSRYSQAAHRNKVTVDEKGRLYQITPEGSLKVFAWSGDDATGGWTAETADGKVLDTGWGQYDLVVAAGDGVLYARRPSGELFRFRWHAASDRFVQHAAPAGAGWNMFNRIFSAGGDVLYGTRADNGGELLWYRYDEVSGTWADTGRDVGKLVGFGWHGELDVVANPNGCRLSGNALPTRPSVPVRRDAPTAVRQAPDGKLSYFYTNSEGGLTAATQRYPDDFSFLDYQTFTGHHGFSGVPGAAVRGDGRFEVLANSSDDGEYRGRTQQVRNGAWGPGGVAPQGGWLLGDPVAAPEVGGALSWFGVDASGGLWRRTQVAADGAYLPWRRITASGLSADLTALRNGDAVDVVARFADGTARVARVNGSAQLSWRTVGSGVTGLPAAVAHGGGALQVFTRRDDGYVHTQREAGGAFPGTWQRVGDLQAAGSPAAVLTGDGLVELAARGDDGYVHQAGQQAPAGGFGNWTIRYFEDAATDPAGLVLASGSPVFTWRTPGGLIATSYVAPWRRAASGAAGTTARG